MAYDLQMDATPNNLWTTYFSSSRRVYELIKLYGKDSFTYKVTNIFTNSKDAVLHEHLFLTKVHAKDNIKFINCHNGSISTYTNTGLKAVYHKTLLIEGFHDSSLPLPVGWTYGFSPSHLENLKASNACQEPWNKNKTGYTVKPCSKTRREKISASRKQTNKILCQHCGKHVDPGNYKRFHGDNCKFNPDVDISVLDERSKLAKQSIKTQKENSSGAFKEKRKQSSELECPHCGKKSTNHGMMIRCHFDNCKSLQ